MSFLLPPYRKLHIVILGGIVVILAYDLLFTPIQPWFGLTNPSGWYFAGVHVPAIPWLADKNLADNSQNGSGTGSNNSSGGANGSSGKAGSDPARSLNKSLPPAQTVTVSAASVKKDFAKPLSMLQDGGYDTAASVDNFIIIDIRPTDQYNQGHITGALSVPINALPHSVFDPSLKVVIYGSDSYDLNRAAALMGQFGITKVYLLTDSIASLRQNGYKITP